MVYLKFPLPSPILNSLNMSNGDQALNKLSIIARLNKLDQINHDWVVGNKIPSYKQVHSTLGCKRKLATHEVQINPNKYWNWIYSDK